MTHFKFPVGSITYSPVRQDVVEIVKHDRSQYIVRQIIPWMGIPVGSVTSDPIRRFEIDYKYRLTSLEEVEEFKARLV
jgi:hypothetical protein